LVNVEDPRESLAKQYGSQIEPMDRSADQHRDFDAFVLSASAEARSIDFVSWAGGERVTLAIVFTDIVGSTALGEMFKDESMREIRRDHFKRSRTLIAECKGREIKTTGDGFMTAFRSVAAALDYARALQRDPGRPELQVRAGIHIGSMDVEHSDVFGTAVNFAARVVGAMEGAEICLSNQAKADVDDLGARKHKSLRWRRHENVTLKGFAGEYTLWSLVRN
jgi:class 3 adenylate cyclase